MADEKDRYRQPLFFPRSSPEPLWFRLDPEKKEYSAPFQETVDPISPFRESRPHSVPENLTAEGVAGPEIYTVINTGVGHHSQKRPGRKPPFPRSSDRGFFNRRGLAPKNYLPGFFHYLHQEINRVAIDIRWLLDPDAPPRFKAADALEDRRIESGQVMQRTGYGYAIEHLGSERQVFRVPDNEVDFRRKTGFFRSFPSDIYHFLGDIHRYHHSRPGSRFNGYLSRSGSAIEKTTASKPGKQFFDFFRRRTKLGLLMPPHGIPTIVLTGDEIVVGPLEPFPLPCILRFHPLVPSRHVSRPVKPSRISANFRA
ncbi:MAG TPA: hypothetical protein PLZ73_02075 [bacterium]|nr:hypothetical protein [bacterium]